MPVSLRRNEAILASRGSEYPLYVIKFKVAPGKSLSCTRAVQIVWRNTLLRDYKSIPATSESIFWRDDRSLSVFPVRRKEHPWGKERAVDA